MTPAQYRRRVNLISFWVAFAVVLLIVDAVVVVVSQ